MANIVEPMPNSIKLMVKGNSRLYRHCPLNRIIIPKNIGKSE